MLAIYKRELRAYFHSVIGCLFIAAALMLTGLYFTVYCLLYGYPYISYVLSGVTFLFLITIPVLTMRILAEERRAKTDQLILTAPVSVGQVVLGKYLAMATVFFISILVVCTYPLILSIFGSVPMGESYTAILGYFLMGLLCIAVGMFISSLTESQVIAAVLTFAILFLGYMMNSISNIISSTGNVLTGVLKCFDLYTPLDNFMSGLFDMGSLVYYLSLTVLFIFLTCQSIQKRRWSISTRSLKTGAYSTGMIAVAVAATVVVNLIAAELPKSFTQLDVTSRKLYSLTDETEALVGSLSTDVTIYVLASEDSQDTTLQKTLSRYEALSDHLKVEYKDPAIYPNFYKTYTDSTSSNSLIVTGDKRSRVVSYDDIYEYDYDYTTYQSTVSGYDAEGQITSAISYVISEDTPVIYAIEGHDETALDAGFTTAIEKENVTLESINLLQYDAVPEDATAILLLGPQSDLSEDDASKIIAYLKAGGKALITVAYTQEELPNFDSVLAAYGVTDTGSMIVEGNQNYYYQTPFYLLPEVASTAVTSSIYNSKYVFAPYAMALSIDGESNENLAFETLLSSSEDAYGKADPDTMETYEKADGDVEGPFTIGTMISEVVSDGEEEDTDAVSTQIALFSSAYIFTDSADQMVSGANTELFSGVISSFTGKEESTSIPSKSYTMDTITISQSTIVILGLLITALIPLVILILGIAVWMNRRKR